MVPSARRLFAASLLLALPDAARGAPPPSSALDPLDASYEGQVTVRLLADVVSTAPGDSFQLAIEITMGDGWHTYWENGGDAGLPTTVTWELPQGFEAGEILWPVPHRYEEAGDLVTFGYADRVTLLTAVTVEKDVALSPVTIRGAIEWLQCKDICIPGGSVLELRLPVEEEGRRAPPEVLKIFESTRSELPVTAVAQPLLAVRAFQSKNAIPVGGSAEVGVAFTGLHPFLVEGAAFFPRPSEKLWFRDGVFRSDGVNLGLVVSVEVDAAVEPGSIATLPGVIRVPRPEGPPWLLSFEVPVIVASEGQIVRNDPAPIFSSTSPSLLPRDFEIPGASAGEGVGLARILVLAFFGGLILNVMPCVLPVVSLKILGFVSKADEHPKKVAALGWTFASGVIVSFLVLAGAVVIFQMAGEHIGWGFQFQSPAFVAALSVIVFLFSLSLLGVFEIGVMLSTTVGLGILAVERKEFADAFFHGVLTTILATPCTAPMLGTAIAFAFAEPPATVFLVFMTVGLGLALPYVLLSLHPAWLKYVPKPGPWMEIFKQAMGFLLLATLVWLLSVFGAQIGPSGIVWLLAFLLVLGLLAWLHGRFLNLMSSRRRHVTIWVVTIVATIASYQQFLHERLFAQPDDLASSTVPGIRASKEVTKGGIVWEPFSVEHLEEAVKIGRTVFLDFTAEWCWTCKVNEKTVLADEEVEAAFRENRVLTLKGDWTSRDPEITEILRRHKRAGVPFYAIYPGQRPSEVIVLPEIINKKLVLDSLERAGPSVSSRGA